LTTGAEAEDGDGTSIGDDQRAGRGGDGVFQAVASILSL
jgi:hypothetical protein